MSIKVLDTDTSINLFERMKSFDCIPYLSKYHTMYSDIVWKELTSGNSYKSIPFETYRLSSEEQKLFDDTTNYMSNLGCGERSAMIHALFLSNEHSCNGDDKIVVICNDKEANHIFRRDLPRDPMMRRMFPNMEKIVWVKTIDVLEKMWIEGAIDKSVASEIYNELKEILGPKLDFLFFEGKSKI